MPIKIALNERVSAFFWASILRNTMLLRSTRQLFLGSKGFANLAFLFSSCMHFRCLGISALCQLIQSHASVQNALRRQGVSAVYSRYQHIAALNNAKTAFHSMNKWALLSET
jgi:hypothetical protein